MCIDWVGPCEIFADHGTASFLLAIIMKLIRRVSALLLPWGGAACHAWCLSLKAALDPKISLEPLPLHLHVILPLVLIPTVRTCTW